MTLAVHALQKMNITSVTCSESHKVQLIKVNASSSLKLLQGNEHSVVGT